MKIRIASLTKDQKETSSFCRCKFLTLTAANAAVVAALYLSQTMMTEVAQTFPNSYLVSLVPSMTLAGYASGVALVAFGSTPRARLSVERHLAFLAVALLAASQASSLLALTGASFFVGCGAAAAPRLLASAAGLVKPEKAGAAIGLVLCVSLVSILCIRLFGGGLAAIVGWRTVLVIAAGMIVSLDLLTVVTRALRLTTPSVTMPTSSLTHLWRLHAPLRRAATQQAALFAAYTASWMSVLVEQPADVRPLIVLGGSFSGILAALLAGWFSDRHCLRKVARLGAAAVFLAASFVLPAAYNITPGRFQVLLLLVGMALVDAGLQTALVANQKRIQGLEPGSRSRLAASLTVSGFLGGAVGAGAGHVLWLAVGGATTIGFVALAGCVGLSSSLLPSAPVSLAPRRQGSLSNGLPLGGNRRGPVPILWLGATDKALVLADNIIRGSMKRKNLGSQPARHSSSTPMRVTPQ